MRDLDELLEREAIRIQPSGDGLERTLARAHRRRLRRRVVAGFVGLAVAAAGFAIALTALMGTHHTSTPAGRVSVTPSEPGDQGNLVFEVLGVRAGQDQPRVVVVRSRIDWTGDTFPGVHRCTWSVFGPDGSLVGRMTTQVLALEPGHATPPQTVEVSGPAATARVTCDPQRLDVGNPYAYEFTGVKLDPPGYVTYRERWLGQGEPGAVFCTLTVEDQTGRVLAQQDFTFHGTSDPRTGKAGIGPLSGPATGDVSAHFQCEPYLYPPPPRRRRRLPEGRAARCHTSGSPF